MKKLAITAGLLTLGSAGAQSVEFGVSGGYYGGLAADASVKFTNLGNTALALRATAGYAFTDAFDDDYNLGQGVTIRDFKNAGGKESGRTVSLKLDGMYNLGEAGGGVNTSVYGGVRYAFFAGELSSDGSTLSVTSNVFGVGAGVLVAYPVARNVAITGDAGVDKYFKSTFTGTFNGDRSDPIRPGEAGYAETDAFVQQPDVVFKAKVGVSFSF